MDELNDDMWHEFVLKSVQNIPDVTDDMICELINNTELKNKVFSIFENVYVHETKVDVKCSDAPAPLIWKLRKCNGNLICEHVGLESEVVDLYSSLFDNVMKVDIDTFKVW